MSILNILLGGIRKVLREVWRWAALHSERVLWQSHYIMDISGDSEVSESQMSTMTVNMAAGREGIEDNDDGICYGFYEPMISRRA